MSIIFRGMIISSCMGKLFIKIFTRRIDTYLRTKDIWKINQCGFKSDHRTEDNLFILKTLHESYAINRNRKIYAAFKDVCKFFDMIDRNLLYYKLLKYNITDNIYNIIKSMYAKARYSVMINGSTSPQFISTSGVKQGCSMSPILSNLFQNDIHDIFNDTDCDPVKLLETHFNSISWADDLLLSSCLRKDFKNVLTI